jgi:hypothetical protein
LKPKPSSKLLRRLKGRIIKIIKTKNMKNGDKIYKIDSELAKQRIETMTYYTIDDNGDVEFDDDAMKAEFEEKLKALKERYKN